MRDDGGINLKLSLTGMQRLVAGHPWLRPKDLLRFKTPPPAGELVRVQDAGGNFLGWALSEGATGEVAYRMLTKERRPALDAAWWAAKVERALGLRRRLMAQEPEGAYRLINGENDGLPGLFCDRFSQWAVLDVMSPGMMPWLSLVENALKEQAGLKGLLRKVRFAKGGSKATRTSAKQEVVPEPAYGEVPRGRFSIREAGLSLRVDLWQGAHEGLFLDHRANRSLVAAEARGREVLNGFCYTGGFSAACLKAGATRSVNVDLSKPALDWARENLLANGFDPAAQEWHSAEMFEILGAWAKKGRRFGMVIMDPPPYARHRFGSFKASADYAKLAERSFKVCEAGGRAAFACGAQDYGRASFLRHLEEAAQAAGARCRVLALGSPGEDFPALKGFPEGDHQKFALLAVDELAEAGKGALTGV